MSFAVNQLRGLLIEFGIVFAKGIWAARTAVPPIHADETNELPPRARQLLRRLFNDLCELDRLIRRRSAHSIRARDT